MTPRKPHTCNLKHKYNHKRRKYLYNLQLSKKYTNRFKKVLRQFKWMCIIKHYKIQSVKKSMTFKFKQAMLKANYANVLFTKHNITSTEVTTFMIPSIHNPYKTQKHK